MTEYWERRYAGGGISGPGSRGAEAEVKVLLLRFVIQCIAPKTILDLGCGDGVVISEVNMPIGYVGYDPAPTALERCRELMPHLTFTGEIPKNQFDLVVSMDVMHHLVNGTDYAAYLATLLGKSRSHVLVYGTNQDQRGLRHVLHREWVKDIPGGWVVAEMPTKFKTAWVLTREDEQ